MRKPLALLFSFILLQSLLFSQSNESKIGLWNQHLISNIQDQNSYTEIIVKGTKAEIQGLCAKYDAKYLYSIGPFQRISIPVKNVAQIASETSVKQIGNFSKGGISLMDTARILTNVDSAHAGISPLLQAYTGDGVIIGLIDNGIDYKHTDFLNADGSTRIKFLWDQNISSSLNPLPYTYGKEWNFMEINAGMCTHLEQGTAGHGTHVAGISAGNGNGNTAYTGIAPKSDLIIVSIDFGADFLTNLIDAVDYIFKKADALGKPCVINTSIGEYYGARDGKDMTSAAIEYLLDERPGRVVVGSAGNTGDIPYHAQFNLITPDTSFLWFKDIAYSGRLYYDFWANTSDLRDVFFTVGAIDRFTLKDEGNIAYINVNRDIPSLLVTGSATIRRNIINNLGQFMGQVQVTATQENNSYHFEFEIEPDSTNKYYTLSAYGNGKIDLWASSTYIGTSNIVNSRLPSDTIFPSIIHYVYPDLNQTIVSNWQCSKKVIMVGNYSNRSAYFNYDSTYSYSGAIPGMIDGGSSRGPSRDGRIKPDITAPGGFVLACGNTYWTSRLISSGQGYKVAAGGLYVRNTGTSMSSPMVTGGVALLLQKYPNLYASQVKEILFRTVKKDTFTTPTANNTYGMGKLNVYQALIYPVVFGCMDTGSFNYNPLANIEDNSCIAKIYGCTDTAAFNYNASANTDDGSCVAKVYGCRDSNALNYNPLANIDDTCIYAPSYLNEAINAKSFSVYPNPATSSVYFQADVNDVSERMITISDPVGSIVQTINLNTNSSIWYCETFARGNYFYVIKENNLVIARGKLVLK